MISDYLKTAATSLGLSSFWVRSFKLKKLTNINPWSIASNALRAGPDAHPPLNMLKVLILMGVLALALCSPVLLLRGEQKRRLMDEEKISKPQPFVVATGTTNL